MKRLGRALIIAGLLGMLGTPCLQAAAQPQSPIDSYRLTATVGSRVDKYLAALSKSAKFSGVVIVAQHGTSLLARGYGMADRAHQVTNRPDTLYPAVGISRTFPVLGIVQLLQRGRVKLGDSICKYIARCPAGWHRVTIETLQNGRAGLPDVDWEAAGSLEQAFATCKGSPPGLAPGEQVHFGNCATYVRAAIIQRVTGKPWATYLQVSVWRPAGMAHTGRLLDALKPPKRAAAYSGSGPGTDNPWSNYYQAYSTALDVERYDRALFGGKLVSSRWLERMLEPQAVAGPPDPTDRMAIPAAKSLHYAYDGWTTGVLFGQRVVFFAGSLGSFGGVNLHFPDEGVDIFVVSNDDTNQIGRIAQQVVKLTLDG